MRPKRLDIFILKSFLLLFVAAFAICLFVLLMNILWRYAEDIVGKGLDFITILQFFWYYGIALVPEALPLAVLMASLITFGNMGERLELLAMKTAGIPLLRIMRPVMLFAFFLAGVSFYFQNVTVPKAAKHLYSLIYSITEKSPELEIPAGSFYSQLKGYNMYVRHKDFSSGMMYDVTIYDYTQGFDDIRVTVADSAMMETTGDKQYMYLRLYSGEMNYRQNEMNGNYKSQAFSRESFREKHILLQFNSDLKQAPESVIRNQALTKNMANIKSTIDTLTLKQDSVGLGNLAEFKGTALVSYRMSKSDSLAFDNMAVKVINADSIYKVSNRESQVDIKASMRTKIQTQASDLAIKATNMRYSDKQIRKHWIQWMKKITSCVSILIFFFIGAPLGAIIKKGGLGVPVLISVFTYITFYLTSVSGDKMFREGDWNILGTWLSVFVLAPVSVFFTYKANRDTDLFQFDVILEFIRYWFGTKVNRNITRKDVVIDDPDNDKCLGLLTSVKEHASSLEGSSLLNDTPSYRKLLFGSIDISELNELDNELEGVINDLGNSRDRVVIEMLNGFPLLQIHGIQSPFGKKWADRLIGVLFPVGLLFELRAWLFQRKLKRQMSRTSQTAVNLIDYLKQQTK